MKKKKSRTAFKLLAVVLFLLLLVVFLKLFLFSPAAIEVLMPLIPETSTVGYTQVVADAYTQGDVGVVTLSSDCYQMEGTTDAWIAESIVQGLANKTAFRPDAHDVIRDVFKSLDIKVLMVKVVDIVNNTFIGRLVIKQGDKIASLDIRPSNAAAIAVRVGAPIYVKTNLLEEYGRKLC